MFADDNRLLVRAAIDKPDRKTFVDGACVFVELEIRLRALAADVEGVAKIDRYRFIARRMLDVVFADEFRGTVARILNYADASGGQSTIDTQRQRRFHRCAFVYAVFALDVRRHALIGPQRAAFEDVLALTRQRLPRKKRAAQQTATKEIDRRVDGVFVIVADVAGFLRGDSAGARFHHHRPRPRILRDSMRLPGDGLGLGGVKSGAAAMGDLRPRGKIHRAIAARREPRAVFGAPTESMRGINNLKCL